MSSKRMSVAPFLLLTACLLLGYSSASGSSPNETRPEGATASIAESSQQQRSESSGACVLYSQPPNPAGGLLPSARLEPDRSSYRAVWDNFTLQQDAGITAIQWRGGFDPGLDGSGGPVIDFVVAFYGSTAGGTQPDISAGPLVSYMTGGDAGQTLAGTVGGVVMYDYQFTLPTAFPAITNTKYWVLVEALQAGDPAGPLPDWGLSRGTGGDGIYFVKFHTISDIYLFGQGDGPAFTLLACLGPNARKIYLPLDTR